MIRVAESLKEKSIESANFVMVLSMWKRITPIFENLSKIGKKGYTKVVMPALLMLPLLIYEKINNNQAQYEPDKNEAINESMDKLV
jgi:hypothetical protein